MDEWMDRCPFNRQTDREKRQIATNWRYYWVRRPVVEAWLSQILLANASSQLVWRLTTRLNKEKSFGLLRFNISFTTSWDKSAQSSGYARSLCHFLSLWYFSIHSILNPGCCNVWILSHYKQLQTDSKPCWRNSQSITWPNLPSLGTKQNTFHLAQEKLDCQKPSTNIIYTFLASVLAVCSQELCGYNHLSIGN